MDKQKIGLIGAIVIATLVIGGALYLTAKGLAVPPWLAALLGLVTWVLKSPLSSEQK